MYKWMKLVVGCYMVAGMIAASGDGLVWDMEAILNDSLDAEITAHEVVEGVVYETVALTSREVDGVAERIMGIFAYPVGAQGLPGVFWSQNGMAPANRYFPGIYARKGYASFVVTLPVRLRNGYNGTFDTTNPGQANLVLLARDQMRGITYMTQRDEVDPDRLAVAGSSYGGLFSSVIAGVDPRIKAGVSFFAGGHQARGTNLPQFNRMQTLEDVEVWNRTFDAAFHLKNRAIPFMWGISFNDHWFHFPAVSQTYDALGGTDRRIVNVPHWQHAFPPAVDATLLGFLDTVFQGAPAYLAPGDLRVIEEDGTAIAVFSWDAGARSAARAELVVSYGANRPWLGWSRRAAFVYPAEIVGNVARVPLPVFSPEVPLVLWGTVTDLQGMLTSTPHLYLETDDLASLPTVALPEWNAFPDGDFGDDILNMFRAMGEPLGGVADRDVKFAGAQSLRIDPPQAGAAARPFTIRYLHWVPGLAHQFHLQVRADEAVELTVRLSPVRPPNWRHPLVRTLAAEAGWGDWVEHWDAPVEPVEVNITVGPEWSPVELPLTVPDAPVEGWSLEILQGGTTLSPYWIDGLRMVPLPPR